MTPDRGLIIFLDACAGISGDMFLGAMADIASRADPTFDIGEALSAIAMDGWDVSARRETRGGITGLKVTITQRARDERGHDNHGGGHEHPRRTLADIIEILSRSRISGRVREKAGEAFTLLAETEGKIHSVAPDEVHFHEVGAVDSIADITGAMILMERLGWPRVMSSPVNVGSGTVKCAHGILPVPSPATAELLAGMRVFSAGAPMERTTPTGALLLRALAGAGGFAPMTEGKIICSGYGLGERDTPDMPNALRAILLEPADGRFIHEDPSLLEANIDDMNSQDFALAMERLLESGALDAWCENILMKKGRPAIKLCCLSKRGDEGKMAGVMMRETTTIGVRIIGTKRLSLERALRREITPLGEVSFKSVAPDGQITRSVPEYEDLVKIAREKNLPLQYVRDAVVKQREN